MLSAGDKRTDKSKCLPSRRLQSNWRDRSTNRRFECSVVKAIIWRGIQKYRNRGDTQLTWRWRWDKGRHWDYVPELGMNQKTMNKDMQCTHFQDNVIFNICEFSLIFPVFNSHWITNSFHIFGHLLVIPGLNLLVLGKEGPNLWTTVGLSLQIKIPQIGL